LKAHHGTKGTVCVVRGSRCPLTAGKWMSLDNSTLWMITSTWQDIHERWITGRRYLNMDALHAWEEELEMEEVGNVSVEGKMKVTENSGLDRTENACRENGTIQASKEHILKPLKTCFIPLSRRDDLHDPHFNSRTENPVVLP